MQTCAKQGQVCVAITEQWLANLFELTNVYIDRESATLDFVIEIY